ncbi:MAG TPA: TIGR00730 family Rossman fold protein [Verrucomicrobiota bacterium]|nr:TIGR00730 family Rossman fold protein [Verrucomicrobiota bacterium]
MSKTPRTKKTLPQMPTRDAWAAAWQKHWSKVGQPGFELPTGGGPGDDEREFLTTAARTVDKERARLKRIQDEFIRGFRGLFHVGPARATGAELARAGFATLTGGGPGIMEAANRGAHEAGGASYGLNIILPHEQGANPYVKESIEFHYFFTRKVCLVKYSCAFIIMPGGLGTLDEMFEAATLIQCRKIGPFPLILMGSKFWRGMREWGQQMMQEGVFGRDEIGFGYVTDDPAEAVDLIVRSLPPKVTSRLQPLAD